MEKAGTSTSAGVSSSKVLHKVLLYTVKVIPMVISGIYVLNTVLSYYCIDLPVFSYLVQYLFILFIYLASFTFKFCRWHRMFIHYITVILTINIVDYHWGIPVSDRGMLLIYGIITGVFLFVIVYLKFRRQAR